LKKIRQKIKIKISVDTYKYSVMHRALDCGVNIINDIFAMQNDDRIPGLLSRYSAGISLMHMRGTPQTMQSDTSYEDVVLEVIQMLEASVKRAVDAGVDPAAIVVDPGIGFGKSVDANFELLACASKIKTTLKKPLLIGISNKSFIKKSTDGNSKSITAAMNALHGQLIMSGTDILRVHDIIDGVSVRDVYQKFIEAHSAGNT
ncbi:MAG: dihydropteroate synthase, partial [Candidatus Omnitrophica bacterium]|nr:dihydropteroate synthase [Candidatus Omnitrophota bacterium]